jgi:hypothetical protein
MAGAAAAREVRAGCVQRAHALGAGTHNSGAQTVGDAPVYRPRKLYRPRKFSKLGI